MNGYFICKKNWELNGRILLQSNKEYKGKLKQEKGRKHLSVKCESGAWISFFSGSKYFDLNQEVTFYEKIHKKEAEIYRKDIESIFEPLLKDGKPINLFEERKVNYLK